MADSTTIEPTTNQYIELRATKIKDVEGNGKQVIFELWGHDIKFKGFDVRFSYDGNIFSTSNLITMKNVMMKHNILHLKMSL